MGSTIEDFTGINLSDDSSSDRAVRGQQAAASSSTALSRQMYDQARQDLQPYQQAGAAAVQGMQNPEFQKDFTMADFTADPGFQFRMDEGNKAIERSAAARGGRHGGATMKALSNYGQNTASAEYQGAYDRFNANADRRFGRLNTISNSGLNATGAMTGAGQNYANQYTANTTGAANAAASQAMGQAAQTSGLIGQGMTMAGMMSGGAGKAAGTSAAYASPLAGSIYGGSGLAFCDERLKENIVPVTKDELQEMKAQLKAYKFTYASEVHGEGEFIGVMAQDLEKSKVGRMLVTEDASGNKQIDLQRVMMLFLATMAEG